MLIEQNNANRTFLSIKDGKLWKKVQGQEPKSFAAIEGQITSIARRTAVIKDQETTFLDIVIEDGGETFVLSVDHAGSVARGIILCLASVTTFVGARVRISPYLSKDGKHSNIAVNVNGQKVSWVTDQIPKVKEVSVGSKVVIDDTERLAFINAYIDEVAKKIVEASATPQARARAVDDLPGDDDKEWLGQETL